jgi:methyltransferase (TIGR00027 family)
MAHPVAETAVGPMTIVAVEQYEPEAQRLVHNDLAYHFLPSGVRRIVRLARWRPMRDLLFGVTEKTAHGIWGSMLCRKRFIDDTLRESAPNIDAVVILGAGLDTRAYRLVEQAGAEEYTMRYVAPRGRALPVSELERSVYAEKR